MREPMTMLNKQVSEKYGRISKYFCKIFLHDKTLWFHHDQLARFFLQSFIAN